MPQLRQRQMQMMMQRQWLGRAVVLEGRVRMSSQRRGVG
jgi:hypothetical protein